MNTLISPTYLVGLDGLRGVAITLVVISHLGLGHIIPGGFGVTLFFYVSGLLITRLLLVEYQATGTINLKEFYIRRLLRLYPSLIVSIIVTALTASCLGLYYNYQDILAGLLYYQNYYMLYGRDHFVERFFDILWSLAIEEHFYLFFPLLLVSLAKSKRNLLICLCILCVLILSYRIYIMQTMGVNFLSIAINYHLTHTRADAILFGCISAVLLAMIPQKYIAVSQRPVFFSMGFVLLLGCFIYRSDYFRETFRYSLQGIAFMLIIPPLIFGNGYQALQKILSDKRLVFIGKLSYSLYLYHWLAMRAMDTATHANGKLTFNAYLLAAVIGVMLSIINYFIVEIPMKSVRRKFGSNTI